MGLKWTITGACVAVFVLLLVMWQSHKAMLEIRAEERARTVAALHTRAHHVSPFPKLWKELHPN